MSAIEDRGGAIDPNQVGYLIVAESGKLELVATPEMTHRIKDMPEFTALLAAAAHVVHLNSRDLPGKEPQEAVVAHLRGSRP